LLEIACRSLRHSRADLIVANEFNDAVNKQKHKAFIIDSDRKINIFHDKENIAEGLLDALVQKLRK